MNLNKKKSIRIGSLGNFKVLETYQVPCVCNKHLAEVNELEGGKIAMYCKTNGGWGVMKKPPDELKASMKNQAEKILKGEMAMDPKFPYVVKVNGQVVV